MNDFGEFRSIDLLVWLSTILTHESVMIGEELIKLNQEILEVNKNNYEYNREALSTLKNIENYLSILVKKDSKN